jgi:DNA primase
MYEDNEIQDFINKLDIVQVISEYVNLKKSGANYKGLSPFKPERTPSFTVSPGKNIFKDFSSGIGGDVITFYMKINNLTFAEAVEELANKYNIPLNARFSGKNSNKQQNSMQKFHMILQNALEFYSENIFKNKKALSYLERRGLNENDIRKFKLGYAPENWDSLIENFKNKEYSNEDLIELGLIKRASTGNFFDVFRDRIIFPIYNKNQNIVGFGGRALDGDNTAKYINSQESKLFNKSREVYGLVSRGEKIRKKGFVILMEGYMDVLSAHKNDFENAVASLGTAFTDEQAKLLKRYTNNIVIAYDSDEAGKNALFRAAYILKKYEFNVKCLFFPKGIKDPDEFFQSNDKKKFVELLKESVDIFEYMFSEFSYDIDIKTVEGKKIFIDRFKEFFANLQNRIEIDIYLDKLSEELGISKQNLEAEVLKDENRKYKKTKNKEFKKEEISIKNKLNYDLLEVSTLKLILKYPRYYKEFEEKEIKSFIIIEILKKLKKIDFNTKILDNSEIDEEEKKLIFKFSREADLEIEKEEEYYKILYTDWFNRELEKEIQKKKPKLFLYETNRT